MPNSQLWQELFMGNKAEISAFHDFLFSLFALIGDQILIDLKSRFRNRFFVIAALRQHRILIDDIAGAFGRQDDQRLFAVHFRSDLINPLIKPLFFPLIVS